MPLSVFISRQDSTLIFATRFRSLFALQFRELDFALTYISRNVFTHQICDSISLTNFATRPTRYRSSILRLDFANQFRDSFSLINFATRFRSSILRLDFAHQFRDKMSLINFTTPFRSSISLLNFATPFRLSISHISCNSISLINFSTQFRSSISRLCVPWQCTAIAVQQYN